MSFWEMMGFALFCAAREEQKEEQRKNDLLQRLEEADSGFSSFCTTWGFCNILYTPDYSAVDFGEDFVDEEIGKIEEFEEKLHEFISLGGKPDLVLDVEEVDEYLQKAEYLASSDLLDKQGEYMGYDYGDMVSRIEDELEEKRELEAKIAEFAAMGGDPDLILDTDEIDEYLEKIEYLSENGLLHRQAEFLEYEYEDMVEIIEEEEEEDGDALTITIHIRP